MNSNITFENENMLTVQCFKYLKSKIKYDEKSKTVVKSRIA